MRLLSPCSHRNHHAGREMLTAKGSSLPTLSSTSPRKLLFTCMSRSLSCDSRSQSKDKCSERVYKLNQMQFCTQSCRCMPLNKPPSPCIIRVPECDFELGVRGIHDINDERLLPRWILSPNAPIFKRGSIAGPVITKRTLTTINGLGRQ